jgi:hypothetical protein
MICARVQSETLVGPYGFTIVEPILVTEQPQNQTAHWAGAVAHFKVAVSGVAPFAYQWARMEQVFTAKSIGRVSGQAIASIGDMKPKSL